MSHTVPCLTCDGRGTVPASREGIGSFEPDPGELFAGGSTAGTGAVEPCPACAGLCVQVVEAVATEGDP
jgi:DnaJ-class molecular chaperone